MCQSWVWTDRNSEGSGAIRSFHHFPLKSFQNSYIKMQGSTFQPRLDLETFGELENNNFSVWASPPSVHRNLWGHLATTCLVEYSHLMGAPWKPPLSISSSEMPFLLQLAELINFMLPTTSTWIVAGSRDCDNPHFTEREPEAQRGSTPRPRSHS